MLIFLPDIDPHFSEAAFPDAAGDMGGIRGQESGTDQCIFYPGGLYAGIDDNCMKELMRTADRLDRCRNMM